MGSLSFFHWILIGLVVFFLFGRSSLQELGRSLGRAVRGFKEGMNEIDAESRHVEELEDRSGTTRPHMSQTSAGQTGRDRQPNDQEPRDSVGDEAATGVKRKGG
ncbi:MAG: hypothetical protein C5B49_13375 [Bdellovibrio sp.]|nr:MAG: hypothetical protein C5B49_13375 [Bdellovibrio sp.]